MISFLSYYKSFIFTYLPPNVIKRKHTNVRASGSDESIILAPPVKMSLEQALDFIADDELIEITPGAIRLRKQILSESDRKSHSRQKKDS